MPCRVHLLDRRGILHWDLLRVEVVVIGVAEAVFDFVVVRFEEVRVEFLVAINVCVEHFLPRIDSHHVLLMELVLRERDQNCCRMIVMMTSRVGLARM